MKKTIQSVTSQTINDFEFVVVDGGSTDGSKELMNEYTSSINCAISEKDNGIYDAMNKGIKKSKGKYFLFLNSGDYLNDTHVLENALDLLKGENDIIACSCKIEDSNIIEESPNELTFRSFWYKSICHQAVFIKKELFEKHGLYDTSLKVVADWEFFVRTLFLNHASYQQSSIVLSVAENDGLSSSPDGYLLAQEERKKVYMKLFPRFIDDFKKLMDYENSPLHRLVNKFRRSIGNKQ